MTDSIDLPEAPGPESQAPKTLESLERSIRGLRRWLIAITAVMALGVLATACTIGFSVVGVQTMSEEIGGVTDTGVRKTEQQIRDAYGSSLKDVEVREVTAEYTGVPFPLSLLDEEPGIEVMYVEYRLKGSDVAFAGLLGLDGPSDVAASGMLPTKGSLKSRMTEDQLERLMAAYSRETKAPLGSVVRYGDVAFADELDVTQPDEITVGSTTYATKELWSATEGDFVKGDKVDLDAIDSEIGHKALIFREDPKTGEFEFLGSEPASEMW